MLRYYRIGQMKRGVINIIITIIGGSGSGKSTLEKKIKKEYEMDKIISYTTRPIRENDNEKDGIDYHFIDEEKFNKLKDSGFFAETGEYNNWHYATAKEDLKDNSVLVVTPSGFRQLKEYNESLEKPFEIISIYLDVDQRSRLIKLLERGDDINEAYRRNTSDLGLLDGVENEVMYIIKNFEFRFSVGQVFTMVEQVLSDYHLHLIHQIYGEKLNGRI